MVVPFLILPTMLWLVDWNSINCSKLGRRREYYFTNTQYVWLISVLLKKAPNQMILLTFYTVKHNPRKFILYSLSISVFLFITVNVTFDPLCIECTENNIVYVRTVFLKVNYFNCAGQLNALMSSAAVALLHRFWWSRLVSQARSRSGCQSSWGNKKQWDFKTLEWTSSVSLHDNNLLCLHSKSLLSFCINTKSRCLSVHVA